MSARILPPQLCPDKNSALPSGWKSEERIPSSSGDHAHQADREEQGGHASALEEVFPEEVVGGAAQRGLRNRHEKQPNQHHDGSGGSLENLEPRVLEIDCASPARKPR